MADYLSYNNGKAQIDRKKAFIELLSGEFPESEISISDLFKRFDAVIQGEDSSVTRNALNNVHGDWYEWLIAASGRNFAHENHTSNVLFLLPNISSFDVAELYVPEFRDLVFDLRKKVKEASSVELITSNPDMVIIKREVVNAIVNRINPISSFTEDSLENLISSYKELIGRCSFDDIVGYISVKLSFRPDRRLQLSHEGSLMKALYMHMQTRKWILNPPGLKYYAVSTKATSADLKGLKTVATHSIINVQSLPQAAVDDVFIVNSLNEAQACFSQTLS